MKNKLMLTSAAAIFAIGTMTAQADSPAITKEEVLAAQTAWGNAIVAIGAAKVCPDSCAHEKAMHVLQTMYAFDQGGVLFKPTVASNPQFRNTIESAHSYFVTGKIEEDSGFALRPWVNVRFENDSMLNFGNVALAMGNYFFTCAEGTITKVEYTKGYIRDNDGNLRIMLQHSSLPFVPAIEAVASADVKTDAVAN